MFYYQNDCMQCGVYCCLGGQSVYVSKQCTLKILRTVTLQVG